MDQYPYKSAVVERLNLLCAQLGIPFELHAPTDLTPSILIGLLESLLRSRLPLSPEARVNRTRDGRVESCKMFLGVLADLSERDLAYISPHGLADGSVKESGETALELLGAVEGGVFGDLEEAEEEEDATLSGVSAAAPDEETMAIERETTDEEMIETGQLGQTASTDTDEDASDADVTLTNEGLNVFSRASLFTALPTRAPASRRNQRAQSTLSAISRRPDVSNSSFATIRYAGSKGLQSPSSSPVNAKDNHESARRPDARSALEAARSAEASALHNDEDEEGDRHSVTSDDVHQLNELSGDIAFLQRQKTVLLGGLSLLAESLNR